MILQNDPVTLEIDGVVHKFRYTDIMLLPHTNKMLKSAIEHMKTPADLQNLSPLLEGLKRAPRRIAPRLYNKMIRKCSELDNLNIILDIIKAVDRTGFKLGSSEKVDELLVWIQVDAIRNDWDKEKLERALKRTQLVLNLLETEKAHWPTPECAGKFPFHRDPQFLAARLHMAAALAVHHNGGKDVDGKVAKFAEELVKLWPEGKGILDLQPMEAYAHKSKMAYLFHRNRFLLTASPILNGLTMATQVVDPALGMQLQNRADAVDAEIKKALAEPSDKPSSGEDLYKTLFTSEQAEVSEEE